MQLICQFRLDISAALEATVSGLVFPITLATEIMQLQPMVTDGLIKIDRAGNSGFGSRTAA